VCGSLAGFNGVCVGSPVEVIKTRVMSAAPGEYKNPIDCAYKMFKNEGISSFYKGFAPNVVKLSLWNSVCFVLFE